MTSNDLHTDLSHQKFMDTVDKILSEIIAELDFRVLTKKVFTCVGIGYHTINIMGYHRHIFEGSRFRIVGEDFCGRLIGEILDIDLRRYPNISLTKDYYLLAGDRFTIHCHELYSKDFKESGSIKKA